MKKKLLLGIILLIFLPACSNKNEPLTRTEFLMDTIVTIDFYGSDDEATMDKVFNRLYRLEEIFSKTIETSDVSKINKSEGKPIKVHDETYLVLKESIAQAERTGGSFDPTIGPLVNLWKINESNEERTWLPKEKDIEVSKALVNYKDIEILEENKVRLKKDGMELDLGGIVKGFATDEIVKILDKSKVKSAMIDLGGDLYAYGKKLDKDAWRIGIQDPSIDGRDYMGILEVINKSVVTSGNYERYFIKDGYTYHHILNKETGYPADSNLDSVTVISDRGIDSDSYATGFFILGVEKTLNLIKNLDGIDCILITKDRKVYLTDGIKDSFKLKEEGKYTLVSE